ncbi:hypothetical protein [Paraburkholderia sp. BL6669N2]|uniref:hypothetical protein n=1 Tax=Paraburkholderia sp. BL6669N2 TaxID=1938807 RepID=UPI0011C03CF9|nr:hypothetical protein [Paraburkholderia sp. BL6669N2]
MFAVKDQAGMSHKYAFTGFGMGKTWALSSALHLSKFALPKIMVKKNELGGAGATTDFPSWGTVFLTDAFKGTDLTDPKSLKGGSVYLEGAGGYLFGASGSLMILGINRSLLVMGIAKPDFIGTAIRTAPAALISGGFNEGLQDSAGGAYLFGQVDYKGLYSDNPAMAGSN